VPDIGQRDPEQVATVLARWLSTKLAPDAAPRVSDVEAPVANGFSNETILCSASWSENGVAVDHPMVVRVAPTRHLLFLDADFSIQYRVMKALSDLGPTVPLPDLGWYEDDSTWLGAPFFTMSRIDGKVPADNLPYTMEGWVVDALPAEQERMWWSGLEALAAVHMSDWRRAGLEWLAKSPVGLDGQLSYYRAFLDWCAKGRPQPVAEAAWEWLTKHQPNEEGDLVLCWGDSRIGNIIWRDFTPMAVLDWEMATIGQPELDLGWWLYFDRQCSEGLSLPRPPGFPSHDETIERYGEIVGRPVKHVEYYEVFSGFRFAVIMVRLTDLLVEAGHLEADTDMGTNNLATQFTAQLLDLPAPS
jgi:aminoglycoside phosphotransferase (APT) family kinase protein